MLWISSAIAVAIVIACGGHGKTPGGDAALHDGPGSAIDAKVFLDARSGAGSGTVCGGSNCSSGEVCCVSGGSASCIASTATCGGGLAFACDGASDCGSNQTCCFTGGSAGGTTCETAGTCAVVACNGSADCTQGNATNCCPIGSSGFNYCGVRCP